MSDWTPTTTNEVRADFIALHTRNFDPYATGRSLTSEEEYYGEGFDRWLEQVKADAWDEGKRAGLRQSDWEHGDTPTMHVAINPYRQEQAEMNSDLAEAWDKGAETAWNRSTPEVNGTRYHWRHEGEPVNPYRKEKDA